MKKIVLIPLKFLLVVTLCLSLVACGGKPAESKPDTETKAGGTVATKTLNILTWKDYGADNPDFIKTFEEKHNAKIVLQYIASQDDQLTKLKTSKKGEIDICLPNCTILEDAINSGFLHEVDLAKIPSFENMFDRFKEQKECIKDGKHYAIPYVWGSTAIAYNTEEITTAPTSVSELFDPKNKGKVSLRDSYDDAIMTTAIFLGQDPNNPSDLNAIKEALLEQKPLNRTYWKTGDDFSKLFANKQITLGLMWSGQTATMQQDGQPIAYVVPKEGAIGWVDNWAIVDGSKQLDLAYAFIEEMIGYDFQYKYASSGGPAPVNKQAAEALDPAYVKAAGMDEDSLNRLFFKIGRTNEIKTEWNELWTEVKTDSN